ncbi:MAG TPA: hypothetical protein VHF26_05125, partial [Trebonia sp.]|nr:hypothetical protein [Trebonia sp.]
MATSAAAGTRTEPPSSRGPAETGTAETGTAGNGPAEARSRDRDEAVKAAWHVLISAKVESWNALERELGVSHGLGV